MSELVTKLKRYVKKKKDGHDLMDAPYEIRDMGPFDSDMSGAPFPMWYIAAVLLFAVFMAYWIWYAALQDPRAIDLVFLNSLNTMGIGIAFVFAIMSISIMIDLHKGIAGAYKYIMQLYLWDSDLKEPRRPEWRVLDSWTLWNPKKKEGSWRDSEEHEEILDKERLQQEKELLIKQIQELKHEQKQEEITQMAEAVDERMKRLGKRFTSATELITAARLTAQAVQQESTHDIVKDIMGLRRRLITIIQAIDVDYFITLLHVEGDLYPLILSEYPLFAGDTETGEAEFVMHKLSVRSWMYWTPREVQNACIGTGLRLDDYTFKIIPDEEEMLIDEKEAEKRWGPIIYIMGSDGQAKDILTMHKQIQKIPDQQDILQTELVYEASISDTLLKKMKLVTSDVKAKDISEAEMKRKYEARSKDTIAEGVRWNRRTGKAGEGGALDSLRNINLRGVGTVVKWLFLMLGLFFFALIFLSMMGLFDAVAWLDTWLGGNETAADGDWDLILTTTWEMIAA